MLISVTVKDNNKQTKMSSPVCNPNHHTAVDDPRAEAVGCGFCKDQRHVEDNCAQRRAVVAAFSRPTVIIMTPVMRYLDTLPMNSCDHEGCTVATNISQCGGCRIFKYCGKAHQRADWPFHKHKCASLKAAAQGEGAAAYAFQLATCFTFAAAVKSSKVLTQSQSHPIFIANFVLVKQESVAISQIKHTYESSSSSSDSALTAELAARIAGDGEVGLAYASILSLIYLSILSDKIAIWKILTAGPANQPHTVMYNIMLYSSLSGGRADGDGAPAWPTRAQLEHAYAQARIAVDAVAHADPSFWPRLQRATAVFDSADRRFHRIPVEPPLSGRDALSWTLHAWVQLLRAGSALAKFRAAASLDELIRCSN